MQAPRSTPATSQQILAPESSLGQLWQAKRALQPENLVGLAQLGTLASHACCKSHAAAAQRYALCLQGSHVAWAGWTIVFRWPVS